ncbi:MAG: PLP-dependent aminotransferase family protein [Planctomycetes bacterium]|nr:PLP-dependent aminotransferase family protein [Planctomycetota bacterium]
MWLELDPSLETPLTRQIEDGIRKLCHEGSLKPGFRLPPERDLARNLGIHRSTVARAYRALAASGVVRSRVGRGTFVVSPEEPAPPPAPAGPRFDWTPLRHRRLAGARWLEALAPVSGDGAISFARSFPDPRLFPQEELRRIAIEVSRRSDPELFQYGPPGGYPPLRHEIETLLARQGIDTSSNRVIVIQGSSQGLDLIAKALLRPDDAVLISSPVYAGAIHLLDLYRVRLTPYGVGRSGFRVDDIQAGLRGSAPRLLHVIPRFHNPTGVSLDPGDERRLLAAAEAAGVPIYEDDFLRDFHLDGPESPSLKALDRSGIVIQGGSFCGLPGFRIGWLVVPEEIHRDILEIKRATDISSSPFLQAVLYEFVRRGAYESHLRAARKTYRVRRDAMCEAIARHFPDEARPTLPRGGLALWVELPRGWDPAALLVEARRAGVVFAPGALFTAHGEASPPGFRLAFGDVEEARIEEGIARLGEVLRRRARERGADPNAAAYAGDAPIAF